MFINLIRCYCRGPCCCTHSRRVWGFFFFSGRTSFFWEGGRDCFLLCGGRISPSATNKQQTTLAPNSLTTTSDKHNHLKKKAKTSQEISSSSPNVKDTKSIKNVIYSFVLLFFFSCRCIFVWIKIPFVKSEELVFVFWQFVGSRGGWFGVQRNVTDCWRRRDLKNFISTVTTAHRRPCLSSENSFFICNLSILSLPCPPKSQGVPVIHHPWQLSGVVSTAAEHDGIWRLSSRLSFTSVGSEK